MGKKRRMPILGGQIMLILLSLVTFLAHFGSPSGAAKGLFMILGFVFLATALLLESVAYEKTIDTKQTTTVLPYLPPPPAKTCPTCHKPLSFIEKYDAWYCFDCKKYSQEQASLNSA